MSRGLRYAGLVPAAIRPRPSINGHARTLGIYRRRSAESIPPILIRTRRTTRTVRDDRSAGAVLGAIPQETLADRLAWLAYLLLTWRAFSTFADLTSTAGRVAFFTQIGIDYAIATEPITREMRLPGLPFKVRAERFT